MEGRVYGKSVLDEGSNFGLVLPAWNEDRDGCAERATDARSKDAPSGLVLPS